LSFDVGAEGNAPSFDPAAIRRIASLATLRGIELVGTFYSKDEGDPLPLGQEFTQSPNYSISCIWKVDPETRSLGTLLHYEALFGEVPEEGNPHIVTADYRAVYQCSGDTDLLEGDLAVFAYWNGVYNTWPYWREFFTSMTNRGGLGKHILPLFVTPQS
jgi:hypothetical protein